MNIDNRNGNFVGGNANQAQMNTGSHVNQTGTWGTAEASKFDELLAAINAHSDISDDEKADAVETLNDLKAKKEAGSLRPSIFVKMWDMLPDAVKILGGAAEVFKMLHGGA